MTTPNTRLTSVHDPRPGRTAPVEWATGVESLFDAWASPHSWGLARSTSQSINNSSDTTITWNVVNWDTDSYTTGATPTQVTIPAGLEGFYAMSAHSEWAASTAGTRRDLYIRRVTPSVVIIVRDVLKSVSSTGAASGACAAIWYLNAGDVLDVRAFQNSGGALNFTYVNDIRCSWRGVWLGR